MTALERHDSVQESERLQDLQAEAHDQHDLERGIGHQADLILLEQALERDQKRLEKTKSSQKRMEDQIQLLKARLTQNIGTTQRAKLENDIETLQAQIDELVREQIEIEDRMNEQRHGAENLSFEGLPAGRRANESQRDYLIRTGKITPFSALGKKSTIQPASNLNDALLDAEEESPEELIESPVNGFSFLSHRNLKQPGFDKEQQGFAEDIGGRPKKRRKCTSPAAADGRDDSPADSGESPLSAASELSLSNSTDARPEEDSDSMPATKAPKKRHRGVAKTIEDGLDPGDLTGLDDGNENIYQSRIKKWSKNRRKARAQANSEMDPQDEPSRQKGDDSYRVEDEQYMKHPTHEDAIFDLGFRIPGDIYPNLFDYQKTGVQWLRELYSQQVGGIIGDEMGLGKTIQVVAFLAGLHYSKMLSKPVVVVCPATVMKQWVSEFHRWWPPFRVTILHSSGSGMMNLDHETAEEERLLDRLWDPSSGGGKMTSNQRCAKRILDPILRHGGVLITTYSGLQTYAPLLIPVDWGYAILDEGHKIRNPNAAITIYCKELRTHNRIILSGTPMQNNLIELWSLFDFVFPMRLGTLVNFRNQFEIPIRQGGYANASNLQVQTALRCAETLKDAISPYLLQRFKADVAADLPQKNEQVLFCRLTKLQRKVYRDFLASDEMRSVLDGRRHVLYGIDILRKICNHPDLQEHKKLSRETNYDYGDPAKAGKMQVVGSLIELWRETGHKTLLFAQHRIMLDILEKYIKSMPKIQYRRMDGNTPIPLRQGMVDKFNNDPKMHVFLLTTKVGGLGINLTGADRVIIFDPDWNPSTDLQARERAWRLGQKREVTIYRLMTAGTIEEKIYHRQIFKQLLTNKILRDPKQRQTFHFGDLHDLFALGDEKAPTETSTLFNHAQVKQTNSVGHAPSALKDDRITESSSSRTSTSDVEAMKGVKSLERFATEFEHEKQIAQGGKNSDSRVLEGIFARSAVHSAVEHEQIIGGKKTVTADPHMLEQEAKKVALAATQELRKADEVARTVPMGTPTWTGQVGISGKPREVNAAQAFSVSNKNNNGLSSSSLLTGLKRGHGKEHPANSPATTSTTTISQDGTPFSSEGRDFGRLIRAYLMRHGGSAQTQMLIDHFNRLCRTPRATAEFRETLKLIASLDKSSRGRGKWVLRDEYKASA